jgi:hypothetical protein
MDKKISKKIKLLSRPPGILTHRYLSQSSDPYISQHLKVLLYKPKDRGVLKYFLIFILKFMLWYFYFGWKRLLQLKEQKKNWTALQAMNNKPVNELLDLLYLTFFCAIPPAYYYFFRLYLFRKKDWFKFIYEHECPDWQFSLGQEIVTKSLGFITSKRTFEQVCSSLNIPCVPTLQCFAKGQLVAEKDIFKQKDFFFKPESGSQSNSCYLLTYLAVKNSYILTSEKNQNLLTHGRDIISCIQMEINNQRFIKQPLLNNHPEITQLCQTNDLVTIRIITCAIKNTIKAISAIMEVPDKENKSVYRLVKIDIKSGQLDNSLITQHLIKPTEDQQKWLNHIAGQKLYIWEDLLKYVSLAHQQCADIVSVGWDVAITAEGVKIIEGNLGWNTKVHQLNNGSSLMDF